MLHTRLRLLALIVLAVALSTGSVATVVAAAAAPTLSGERPRVGGEASLVLKVPSDPRRPTVKVRLSVPAGFAAVRCSATVDWRCRYDPPPGTGPAVIEWVRTGGSKTLEEFSFALAVPAEPGRYPLAVVRVSSPSVTARFGAGKGAAGPAPVLEVLPRIVAGAVTTTTPAPRPAGSGRASGFGLLLLAGLVSTVAATALLLRRRRMSPR